MYIVICIVFFLLYCFFVPFRIFVQHPILTIKYAFIDVYKFFKFKKFNVYVCGKFNAYDSSMGVVFGSGKTLSVVHQVLADYKKYDGKQVYDFKNKTWVTQKIHVLSNISFKSIPFEKLANLGQIVQLCEKYKDLDDEYRHVIIVVIDECQNQLHSRSFKDNISPMMLKQLTECRHFNMSIYYDSPRFKQVDALLRQCTSLNIKNRKLWRFQCQKVYDASEVENSDKLDQVKALRHTGFFITDDLFSSYDTYEIVDNLIKAKDRGDLLSDEEILSLQCNQDINNSIIFPKKIKIK